MWQEQINKGKKALNARDFVQAEDAFREAMASARRDFGHTDTRIPLTFAYLGRVLLFRKNVKEALSALRQASRIAATLNFSDGPVLLADYLWAYLDHENPEAEMRRASKLKALEKIMEPAALQRLAQDLKDLFTVSPKAQPEAPKNEEKPEPPKPEPQDPPKPEPSPGPGPAAGKPADDVPGPTPTLDKPVPKPPDDSEEQLKPKPKLTSFNASIGPLPDKNAAPAPASAPIAAERYSQWAETLHSAMERSQKPQLAELIASYFEMHNLVEETIKLYPPPHKAVGDHFMSLADITNIIGLYTRAGTFYELAVSNYKKALGASHPKTAFAQIHLAEVYGLLDSFDKAHEHFREGFNTLQNYPDLDKNWFQEKVNFFNLLIKREAVEKELFQGVEQVTEYLRQEKYKEADALCLSLADKMIAVYPADHYNFCLLYNCHVRVLWTTHRTLEATVLSRLASYLQAKIKDREDYDREMDELFPEFSVPTLAVLYAT
jgi:tetratricopeptide (TPR) repeat protein